MIESSVFYSGLLLAGAGVVFVVGSVRRHGSSKRARGSVLTGLGVVVAVAALIVPASETRITRGQTRLDEFVPVWQFREFHSLRIAAPPRRVFEAIKRVRADEIRFFRALTWIRRGGKRLPPSILNAGGRESLIDVATRSGFIRLADEDPRELVIGTAVMSPPETRVKLTPESFQKELPPGFALAAMNFLVVADGPGGSLVSTETRVYANSSATRRRFAAYWRVIYPGSALIRRMWLKAIDRRATN